MKSLLEIEKEISRLNLLVDDIVDTTDDWNYGETKLPKYITRIATLQWVLDPS